MESIAKIEYNFVYIRTCTFAGVMIFLKQMKRRVSIWKWMVDRNNKTIGIQSNSIFYFETFSKRWQKSIEASCLKKTKCLLKETN